MQEVESSLWGNGLLLSGWLTDWLIDWLISGDTNLREGGTRQGGGGGSTEERRDGETEERREGISQKWQKQKPEKAEGIERRKKEKKKTLKRIPSEHIISTHLTSHFFPPLCLSMFIVCIIKDTAYFKGRSWYIAILFGEAASIT